MDVAITGSSGLIGTALVEGLQASGHRPISVVRRQADDANDEISWDPAAGYIDAASFDGVDAVVHLAGAGIGDKRWNDAYKQVLVDSRIHSTHLLSDALSTLNKRPKRFLSGSAIGFYGDRGDETLSEASTPGTGFLAELTKDWERATSPATDAAIPTAFLRTGIVMSRDGGVLKKMLLLFKLGLGGRIGSGRQYMSWITLVDEIAAIVHLLSSSITGPVNLTSPAPATNVEFTKALAKAVRRPAVLPVPGFGPKFLLGSEMAEALLLGGQRVVPNALESDGFQFGDPEIESALDTVIHPC